MIVTQTHVESGLVGHYGLVTINSSLDEEVVDLKLIAGESEEFKFKGQVYRVEHLLGSLKRESK